MVIKMKNILQKISKSPKIGSFIFAPTQHYEKFLKKKIQTYRFAWISSSKVYGLLSMPFHTNNLYFFVTSH
jgi:UDP-N-acetylglucosamine 2-epimerase